MEDSMKTMSPRKYGVYGNTYKGHVVVYESRFLHRIKVKQGFKLCLPWTYQSEIVFVDRHKNFQPEPFPCKDGNMVTVDIAIDYRIGKPGSSQNQYRQAALPTSIVTEDGRVIQVQPTSGNNSNSEPENEKLTQQDIIDIKKFYLQKNSESILNDNIKEWLTGIVAMYTYDELKEMVAGKKIDLMSKFANNIQEFYDRYGLNIINISFQGVIPSLKMQQVMDEKASATARLANVTTDNKGLSDLVRQLMQIGIEQGIPADKAYEIALKEASRLKSSTSTNDFGKLFQASTAIRSGLDSTINDENVNGHCR